MIGCRPLIDAEIDALKTLPLPSRDRCLLLMGCTTGFRLSELLSLKVQDVLQYTVTVQRRHTKGRHQSRTVPLHPEARQAIDAAIYEQQLSSTDYLFKSREGANKPVHRSQAHKILKAAFEALGLQGKVASHSMRKYFARAVYEGSGKDIVVTQKALGHRLVSTTGDYLAPQKETVDRIILGLRKG